MNSLSAKKPIIFCDFDGTITANDNIVAIMEHFKPDGVEQIIDDIIHKRISLREGVGSMFALFPSSRKDEIITYALKQAIIREGFPELLAFCKQHDIPFLVTSGGIDFFVYPLLTPYDLKPEQIYCNGSDFSSEQILITWPHACDEHCKNDCGMCKPRVIRQYPSDQYFRMMIGDSISDFEGAKLADLIFARSHLQEKCEQDGKPYVPFETFHEVIAYLQKEVVTS